MMVCYMNINELNVLKLSLKLMELNISTIEFTLLSPPRPVFQHSVLVHSPHAASDLVLLSFTN